MYVIEYIDQLPEEQKKELGKYILDLDNLTRRLNLSQNYIRKMEIRGNET